MGKQVDSHENNVILFPGLVTRLVEKGMASLKEKKYYDALKYFEQSTELESEHPQARYGLVITNIELERLDEAKDHCESMLHEGIGQYYEVLQVYVSLLVQLGDYQKVESLLEGVMSEEKLPPKMAESFYQLLEFSRQMISPPVESLNEEIHDENIEDITKKDVSDWLYLLEQGEPEQQWGALQKLSQMDSEVVQHAYRTFLKGEQNNPVLKSYLLQMLKELNIQDSIEVHKFGETFIVNIEELEDVFQEEFGTLVLKELEKNLGQESPSLFEMVQQMWWHYLFALYPKSPSPPIGNLWAAALHVLGLELMGGQQEVKDVVSSYRVREQDVYQAVEHMKKIELNIFDLNSKHT
ncbi:tetratricopeptide repeat protein [Evansella cellulosilytica]|uniref:Tetratricopeptide repeat protein n=1 Tax=Evansella cellulosilytica (strain ATCC 21833 / DSM 2522 / FERM P-1141 / JCM 9156 / N-4) TaxID=649639 RepID=E6TZS6_EVAC2|nr:tetratricopeptide repeat protein [Evansella cellulosilytica]ADU31382.1 hypothetical protein Bcell_3139 [Evansella cellulosilytica DSM 2522]